MGKLTTDELLKDTLRVSEAIRAALEAAMWDDVLRELGETATMGGVVRRCSVAARDYIIKELLAGIASGSKPAPCFCGECGWRGITDDGQCPTCGMPAEEIQ